MAGKPKDISGKKFGKWTAIRSIGKGNKGEYLWECVCDCGTKKTVPIDALTCGRSSSCGCSRSTHGKSKSILFHVWQSMKQRCLNNRHRQYANYGGRGITVCKEWLSNFDRFEEWALSNGYKRGLQLDRINNNAGYSPENCRWATPMQNENNRRNNRLITVDGVTHTLAEWSRIAGIPSTTILTRLHRGHTFEEAIKKPVQIRKDNKLWQQEQ